MKALLLVFSLIFSLLPTAYASDFTLGDVEWLKDTYQKSDIAVIQLFDPDLNLDKTVLDSFVINVWSDSSAGGIDLLLTETGNNTNIFEGNVSFITAGNSDSANNLLRVSDGDTLTVKYEDKTIPGQTDETSVFANAIFVLDIPQEFLGNFVIDMDNRNYLHGDLVTIIGIVPKVIEGTDIQLTIKEKDTGDIILIENIPITQIGEFTFSINTSDEIWKNETIYSVIAEYASNSDTNSFYLQSTPEQIALEDQISPIVITPDTIKIVSTSSTTVDFSVKAVDDKDGIVDVTCNYPSGSVFPIGKTEVVCIAQDTRGNIGTNVFFVIIEQDLLSIPQWVKQIASFWVGDEIDDAGFIQVIQYLVENQVIIVPNIQPGESEFSTVPSWIKTNAEFWVNGQITDADFATGIEWLINNGIIQV